MSCIRRGIVGPAARSSAARVSRELELGGSSTDKSLGYEIESVSMTSNSIYGKGARE